MSSFYILGIDQSTQGTKAVLFDKYGKIIARADEAHKQIVSDQNWVSHNLEEIYANVIKASRQVVEKAGIDKKQIVCIGIDNQRETPAAWNRKTGKPIADAIFSIFLISSSEAPAKIAPIIMEASKRAPVFSL